MHISSRSDPKGGGGTGVGCLIWSQISLEGRAPKGDLGPNHKTKTNLIKPWVKPRLKLGLPNFEELKRGFAIVF